MKLTIKDFLANRGKIGPALWELLWLMNADSEQVREKEIAKGLGKTPRSVSSNLRRLETEGVIKISLNAGKESRYEIVLGENGDAR